MENSKIRLVEKKEIKYLASVLAESFSDYPLYKILFPNPKTRKRNIRMFYNVSLYARRSYTYVSNDLSFVGCIKRSINKSESIVKTLFKPKFLFTCLPAFSFRLLNKYNDFIEKTDEVRNKFYNPEKDVYIEAIAIDGKARSLSYFLKLFKENYNGETIYAETMNEKLVKLYSFVGLKEKGKTEYEGFYNHVFKKEI